METRLQRPFVKKFRSITWELPQGPWESYVVEYEIPGVWEQWAAKEIQRSYRERVRIRSAAKVIQANFRKKKERKRRREIIRRLYIDSKVKNAIEAQNLKTRYNLAKDHCTFCMVHPMRFVLLMFPLKDSVEDLYASVADIYKKPDFYLQINGKRRKRCEKKLYKGGFHAGGIFIVRICH